MHLVLGPERDDLDARTVVIARDDCPDASDGADAVHRLADCGAVAVALRPGDLAGLEAAAERHLTVLVDPADVAAAGAIPPGQLLVRAGRPVEGAVACADPAGTGPAAWGEVVAALVAGVRVVRTAEPASIRRVAGVVDRLVAARGGGQP